MLHVGKLARYFLFGLLVIALAACGTPTPVAEEPAPAVEQPAEAAPTTEPAAAQPEPAGQVYKIGLSSFQQGNDWNIQVAEGAKAEMEALGWEVIHTNAEANSDAQVTALEGFLTSGVDGVIVAGGLAPALEPVIEKLANAGIKVATVDITSLSAVTNIYIDTYHTTELLAMYSVNRLQAVPGKYVHLTIPGLGWKTVDIRDKVADLAFEIEGWEYLGVLDSGLADAVNQSTTAVRSALLKTPDLNLVYSSWGMPAVGAARAIREAGKQADVFVVCTDADRIVLADMAEDDSPIGAVIGQEPYLMGQMAVQALADAFAGATDIAKVTFAPFVFVTKNPEFLPPGVETMNPTQAWEALYPGVPFGKVD
jgi:ribose transport system substrate-binding protein